MERRKARRGRPKKGQELGERVQLSLRVSPETKKHLDRAIGRNGRSLSQEAEYRIERSFLEDRLILHAVAMKNDILQALEVFLLITGGDNRQAAIENIRLLRGATDDDPEDL